MLTALIKIVLKTIIRKEDVAESAQKHNHEKIFFIL